jgi:SMC interacting uncharacterized protein involved in chromosome segregation
MSDTTTQNAGTWREQLTELLGEQRDTVTRLNELAQQQGDHIRDGKTDSLLTLLSRRQTLIDEFLSTHGRMQSLLANVDEQLKQLNADDRASIRRMIDEINALLGEVLKRDEQDRRSLEEARGGVKGELASMKSGRQARTAYLGSGSNVTARNRFADQQG